MNLMGVYGGFAWAVLLIGKSPNALVSVILLLLATGRHRKAYFMI